MSFKCTHENCDRLFARSENLRRHIRSHDQVQPFQCSVCGKEFSRSDLCRRHTAIHKDEGRVLKSVLGKRTTRRSPRNGSEASEDQESDLTAQKQQKHPVTTENAAIGLHEGFGTVTTINADLNGSPSGHAPDTNFWPSAENEQFELFGDWFDEEFFSVMAEANIFDRSYGQNRGLNIQMDASFPFHFTSPDELDDPDIAGIDGPDPTSAPSSPPPNRTSGNGRIPGIQSTRPSDILTALPLTVAEDHSLFEKYKPTLSFSAECYQRLRNFLKLPFKHGLRHNSLEMPHIKIADLFVELFFARFAVHNPVVHLSTIDSLDDLPDALLAAMMTIGATYSQLEHCRRFAIVLQDVARISLCASLEVDIRHLRDPLVDYAAALICYAGLWSGNKRAFESSELLRATVVSCCRRNNLVKNFRSRPGAKLSTKTNLSQVWKEWVKHETEKRVLWSIYALDCEICILINTTPVMTSTEVALADCPCDEEFWSAPSAKKWKQLLGPALLPPSKRLSFVLAPFVSPGHESFMVRLNAWTRQLVALTLSVDIYHFRQRLLFLKLIDDDSDCDEEPGWDLSNGGFSQNVRDGAGDSAKNCLECSCSSNVPSSTTGLVSRNKLVDEKSGLQAVLLAFKSILLCSAKSYDGTDDGDVSDDTVLLIQLAQVVLDVGIQNLRNAISKENDEIQAAMRYFGHWSNCPHGNAQRTGLLAVEIMNHNAANIPRSTALNAGECDSRPLQFISFFLASLTLWMFLKTSSTRTRTQFWQSVVDKGELNQEFHEMLTAAIAALGANHEVLLPPGASCPSFTTIFFRHSAEVLTNMRPWGAPLGLALLLYQRAKT